MSDPLTLDGIRTYRKSLLAGPLSAYQLTLLQIGYYFLTTRGSDIDDHYVLEVESLLNDLKIHAYKERWVIEDREAIIDCVSKASVLADIIKRGSGGGRSEEFFRCANYLGAVLVSVGEMSLEG